MPNREYDEYKAGLAKAKRGKANAAALGVLAGVLFGGAIHSTAIELGLAQFALSGAAGGAVARFLVYPFFARKRTDDSKP